MCEANQRNAEFTPRYVLFNRGLLCLPDMFCFPNEDFFFPPHSLLHLLVCCLRLFPLVQMCFKAIFSLNYIYLCKSHFLSGIDTDGWGDVKNTQMVFRNIWVIFQWMYSFSAELQFLRAAGSSKSNETGNTSSLKLFFFFFRVKRLSLDSNEFPGRSLAMK